MPEKGTIEVVRIIGPHVSEARVLSEIVARPMLKDDLIFSPVWSAVPLFNVALVGEIDRNGDSISDRHWLHRLVSSSGGRIVNEVDEAGNRTGEGLTADVKFLVVGRIPNPDGSNDHKQIETARKIVKHLSNMRREARELGVRVVSLKDFTAYLLKRRTTGIERLHGLWQITSKWRNGILQRGEIGNILFIVDDYICSTMNSDVFRTVDSKVRSKYRLSKFRINPSKIPKHLDFISEGDANNRYLQKCIYSRL